MIENAAEMTPGQELADRLGIPEERGERLAAKLGLGTAKTDTITAGGEHIYWSTHCRHGRHQACSAEELAPGVPRRPAQCKTCAATCVCRCHKQVEDVP